MTTPDSTAVQEPQPSGSQGDTLLEVSGLRKHFPVTRGAIFKRQVGAVKAVDGIDFAVRTGQTLGLVGESGCGKTTTGRMITRLLEPTDGRIIFEGHDITHLSQGKMRPLRRDVQMIFQDPYSSLNPRKTVGSIVGAPFRLQNVETEAGVKKAVQDLLELVGLNPEHYNRYPHEFSGGQRQRIGIARTLALRPKLIVADEPVSALDVSIQAQVVNLLEDLQDEFDLTYIVIAHDLSVVRHISDRVGVMYLGKMVELADHRTSTRRPMHPYTVALMSAVPVPDPRVRSQPRPDPAAGRRAQPAEPAAGLPLPHALLEGAGDLRQVEPPMVELAPGHQVACHFPENAPLRRGGPRRQGRRAGLGRARAPRRGWRDPGARAAGPSAASQGGEVVRAVDRVDVAPRTGVRAVRHGPLVDEGHQGGVRPSPAGRRASRWRTRPAPWARRSSAASATRRRTRRVVQRHELRCRRAARRPRPGRGAGPAERRRADLDVPAAPGRHVRGRHAGARPRREVRRRAQQLHRRAHRRPPRPARTSSAARTGAPTSTRTSPTSPASPRPTTGRWSST